MDAPAFSCPNCQHELVLTVPAEGAVRGPCPCCGRTIEVAWDSGTEAVESANRFHPEAAPVASLERLSTPSRPVRPHYFPVDRWADYDIEGQRTDGCPNPIGQRRRLAAGSLTAADLPTERRIGQLLPKYRRSRARA